VDGIIARYQERDYGEDAWNKAREIKALLDSPTRVFRF
jgi:hypothetical protein